MPLSAPKAGEVVILALHDGASRTVPREPSSALFLCPAGPGLGTHGMPEPGQSLPSSAQPELLFFIGTIYKCIGVLVLLF